ncbi:MAG: cyclic nucleotide-binding domain-containing protein [Rubrivivax sp.]|nr:cyclic nucleotide-binding domain-containing protein [Rubrivivax sp.]
METPPDTTTRMRAVSELPALAERAADLLRTPQTRLPLNPQEAGQVVAHMGLVSYTAGAAVLREGEGSRSSHLLLLLEGEVQVDMHGADANEELSLSVLGPGSIIGEMSLLDGAPRSATCTALSPVTAAALTRRGLELLIEQQPRTAAKLLMGVAQRLADRLRGLSQHTQMYARLAADANSRFGEGP